MKFREKEKIGSLTLLLAALPGAMAQREEPAKSTQGSGARSPNPALQQLRNLVGTWECRGKVYGWPFLAERETLGEYRFEFELGGFWLNARYDERRSAVSPVPFSTVGHWGWEDLRGRFVVGAVDNLGGFTHSWTTGWEGDTMVWAGGFYGYGPVLPLRETFVLRGGALTHTFEIDKGGGAR